MGYPHEVTFGVNFAIIQTRVFHTKKEHIDMCSYIIFAVYICRIISCLKGFTLFYYIPHTEEFHFKMLSWPVRDEKKFIWRYGMELCFTLELIQNLHAQNDKENGVDFYYSVFPGEAKKCLSFMSFRAPYSALKQKNYHNSPNMLPILNLISGAI